MELFCCSENYAYCLDAKAIIMVNNVAALCAYVNERCPYQWIVRRLWKSWTLRVLSVPGRLYVILQPRDWCRNVFRSPYLASNWRFARAGKSQRDESYLTRGDLPNRKWDLPLLLDVQRLTITNDNYKCSKPTVSDCVPDCVASLHQHKTCLVTSHEDLSLTCQRPTTEG